MVHDGPLLDRKKKQLFFDLFNVLVTEYYMRKLLLDSFPVLEDTRLPCRITHPYKILSDGSDLSKSVLTREPAWERNTVRLSPLTNRTEDHRRSYEEDQYLSENGHDHKLFCRIH